MKGLYIGIRTPGTTSQLRADTLQELLPEYHWVDVDIDMVFQRYPRWARSMWFRLQAGPAVSALNRYVLQQVGTNTFDVTWIDKGVCLWPSTIRSIRERSSKLIYYTPDTSFLANRSRHFFASADLYDLIVTTKSLEVKEFEKLILPERLVLVTQSFDSRLHYPRYAFEEKRSEAVLIGLCEPYREQCVQELISEGIPVRIGGRGWGRFLARHARNSLLNFEGPLVFGDRYADVLSRASVGLGLLTKQFPELHTTRTFEIPACGTALVTESTSEISKIFTEHEALFFHDRKDISRRVSDILSDRKRLQEVSVAGQRRVEAGNYSNERVLRTMLQRVGVPCRSESAISGLDHLAFISRPEETIEQLSTAIRAEDLKVTEGEGTVGKTSFCIGFLGADWWGSDARALAAELRGQGHMLIDRHYEDYFPTKWRSVLMRGLRRLLRNCMTAEYNRAVEELLQVKAMDFLLVFKGMLLSRETLVKFGAAGTKCYCVYPDVSYQDHGANIWECLPLYDCVFTTKSFHLEDADLHRRVRRLKFVPHGFDPEVHRPIPLTANLLDYYSSDLSFVGVWTPKKERILSALVAALPNVSLKIWGPFWGRAEPLVRSRWQGRAAYGDELAAICTNARINLGLLSEAGRGTVKGDQTTARTWQIPACGGFMLHEDTAELRKAFTAGEHIEIFGNTDELVSAIRRYLGDDELRDRVRTAGHQHCMNSGYSYRTAADRILAYHRSANGQT